MEEKSQDRMKLKGHFSIEHIRDGKVIGNREVDNLVTDAGRAEVANLVIGGGTAFSAVAIGTDSTPAAVGQTALIAEISTNGGQRRYSTNVTKSRTTTTVTNDTAKFITVFTFTGSFTVTESGVFNNSVGGTMLCRQVFTGISVVSGDSLQVTWSGAFA